MQNSLFPTFKTATPASLKQVTRWSGPTLSLTVRCFVPFFSRIDPAERKSAAGRKPICRVLMFKMLILQHLHNLSDERLQYQVSARLSFMRFLGLELAGNVPDARTVWAFREALKQHQLTDALFERLNQALAALEVCVLKTQ